MSVVTPRLPDAKHVRLQQLAASRHTSVNRLLAGLADRAVLARRVERRATRQSAGCRLLQRGCTGAQPMKHPIDTCVRPPC